MSSMHGSPRETSVTPAPHVADQRELAARARVLADAAPARSLDRRAYGCVYVALVTTRTVKAAREALGLVHPPEVSAAALARLRELEQDGPS